MEIERAGGVALGFPALTRAKQRFLARRAAVATSRRAPSDEQPPQTQAQDAPTRAAPTRRPSASHAPSTNNRTLSLERVLRGFCHDLDDDLRMLTHEVHTIDASVRQAHYRLCDDLDALTVTFIDREPTVFSSPAKPNPSHEVHKNRRHKKPMANSIKKPKKILTIARQARQLQLKSAAATSKPYSRVARLALQAVHAHVLQHHYRRYLYRRLYCGGSQQFTAARELSKRTSLRRAWRRWLQLITQRQRLKKRFAKLASVLTPRATGDFCALAAAKVLESDGKYAMAKRFHRLKTLSRVLSGWLSTCTAGSLAS